MWCLLMWEKVRGFVAGISMSMIATLYGPEYFGSFPYNGILSRKLSGGRILGFSAFGAGLLLVRSSPLGWPRTASGKTEERGIVKGAREAGHQTKKKEALVA